MAEAVILPGRAELVALRRRYATELLDSIVPFWTRHPPEGANGSYWSCLDRDGSGFDRAKHGWLQGRKAWMLARLHRTAHQSAEWLEPSRFPDPQCGEWCGHLDRRGEVTHRFKGGPCKGRFRAPRALWLCWRLLQELEAQA